MQTEAFLCDLGVEAFGIDLSPAMMSVHVHLRPTDRVAALLDDAGLIVEARCVQEPDTPSSVPQAYLIARRQD